jgi:protein Mpv17
MNRFLKLFSGDFIKAPIKLWSVYSQLLEQRPLLTKSITSGVISLAADVVCQYSFPKKNEQNELNTTINISRTVRFTILGVVYTAPALHYWYGFLGRIIVGNNYYSTVNRVLLDQLLFAPLFLSGFFSFALALEGSYQNIIPKLKADLVSTIFANFSVWIPAQLINFGFVHPSFQVLFANIVGFFWNIYLSKSTNKKVDT